ncbi:MAG TPA: M23 family metallopeptidase [Blastocatellia bacterium]|nr:M23 family metallopeptidase [Blastocatellia bacterium]
MPNLENSATGRALVYSKLREKLKESDPEYIARLSPDEVNEGLEAMNACRKEGLPDAVKILLRSPTTKVILRHDEPGIGRIGYTFAVLVAAGLTRLFLSRRLWVPVSVGFVLGCVLTGSLVSNRHNKWVAVREQEWEARYAAAGSQIARLKGEKETAVRSSEKLSDRLELLMAMNQKLFNLVTIRSAGGNKKTSDDTSPLVAADPDRPLGLPVDRANKVFTLPAFPHPVEVKMLVPPGTRVRTTADGQVIGSTQVRNYGRCVRVLHADGVVTCYGPLASIKVIRGQEVKSGDTLGYTPRVARREEVALRYEVYKDNKPDNVLSYLKKEY